MSGSTTPSASPFTDAERTDIRRFCGYEAYGDGNSGFQSWRFYTVYGVLEYRLSNLSAAELAVVRTTYLANLSALETAIMTAAANLDTAQAAVWTRNQNEVRDRERLFDGWRRRLCGFLGVPPGRALGDGGCRIIV